MSTGSDATRKPRTRRRLAPWISLVVIVVLLVFVVVLATRDTGDDRSADSPLLGQPAPSIAGATVDGGSWSLDQQIGRWTVVNFFATWCVPCRQEHPEMVTFATRQLTRGGDVDLVSVVFDDESEAVAQYFAENGGDWPVVTDPNGRIAVDYGVLGIPESYLIDPDGVVVSKIVGGISADGLEALVTRARQAAAGVVP